MKLKTEMVEPDSTSVGPYPAARVSDDGQDYLHDAACAHALMRALGHVRSSAESKDTPERRMVLRLLNGVDAEVNARMLEWGFDSGEVASGH